MKVVQSWSTTDGKGIAGYHWWCPACEMHHLFVVREYHPGRPVWEFNGDEESPSVKPSIRATICNKPTKDCHVFLTDGKIVYQDDCYHPLKGQTIPMVPVEKWPY
jgi:hypothetical protein